MGKSYTESDRMCDIIADEPHLLQMMSRFNIPLGVGEKTVGEICDEANVDCPTFLAIANFIKIGADSVPLFIERINIPALIAYLTQAHNYFLQYQIPTIRRKLIEAIDCAGGNDVAFLILKFYDEYSREVGKHMELENHRVFTYVNKLLRGERDSHYEIAQFARHHESIDLKLQELKNIIIKYYRPEGDPNLLNTVLFEIFTCEKDLATHCEVENKLFIPAVRRLEENIALGRSSDLSETSHAQENESETLSEREQEVLCCVVRGLTNKETAEKLFISINTVLTHRKNISRKLKIHSVSGLTIYAIVNKLIRLDEVKIK